MGPAELLREVRADLEATNFDQRATVERLGLALEAAQARGDDALSAEILSTRASVLIGNSDLSGGLEDLKQVEVLRPDDSDLKLQVAQLMGELGDPTGALESTRSVIDDDPDSAAAWALMAQFEAGSALSALQPTINEIKSSLVRKNAELASEQLISLACRDAKDENLTAAKYRLEALFPSESKEIFFKADKQSIPEARGHYATARAAYARAVELEPTAERVLALAMSLDAAGQRPLAIRVLSASLIVPSLSSSADIKFELVKLLQRSNRHQEAMTIVTKKTAWADCAHLDYIAHAAQMFYEGKVVRQLNTLAIRLEQLGSDTGKRWALFYRSAYRIWDAQNKAAEDIDPATLEGKNNPIRSLRDFIANEKRLADPFPTAIEEAGFLQAEAALLMGAPETVITGLTEGLKRESLQTAERMALLATALMARTPTPWLEIEAALTNAINLAPERSGEFVDRWLEAGRRGIESRGMTVSDLISEANRSNTAIPSIRAIGPAGYTLIAAKHLEDGRNYSALQAANRAMKEHSRLVPAMDIAIAAKLSTPNRYNVERDLVQRIGYAGIDEVTERNLGLLPRGRLDGKQMIEAIKAEPARFGKAAVARWFLDNGDTARARDALGRLDPRNAPDSLLLLRAQTLLQEGRYAAALEDISRVEVSRRLGQDAALLKARVLLELDRPTSLSDLIRDLDWIEASPETLLELADLLMSKGQNALALEIINGLDVNAETRTPDFYRRRVLVDILTSRQRGAEIAQESIERSEAYLRDGTPEIASILLAVSRRRWTDLPAQIKRLRDSSFAVTPQKHVALVLLAERLEAGRRLASAGLESHPRDPDWALVAAASDALASNPITMPAWFGQSSIADAEKLLFGSIGRASRDPRETLAILLIADLPEWSAWLLPIVSKIGVESGSEIWTNYLTARILEASGDSAAMMATVARLVEKHRRFGPGHEWAIQLAEARHPAEPMHREVVRARRMRLLSLGAELINDPVQVALAEASELARKGEHASAVATLQAVLRTAGESETEARLMLGLLMIKANQPSPAANFLIEAALGDPGIFETVVLDSLIFSLRFAVQSELTGTSPAGTIGKDRALDMLSKLGDRYPLDPMVAIARLELSGLNRERWGDWARTAIDQLYQRSNRQPLEALRRGSTRRWVNLLINIKIDLAKSIVERDLLHEPGNLELWHLRARIANAMNDEVAAAEIYRALLEIDPTADTGFALAEIQIAQGAELDTVLATLRAAGEAQNGGDRRDIYLTSLAQLRLSAQRPGQIIQRLQNAWRSRAREGSGVDPVLLGELYLDSLLRRYADQDVAVTAELLRTLTEEASDRPYRKTSLAALTGLQVWAQRQAGDR